MNNFITALILCLTGLLFSDCILLFSVPRIDNWNCFHPTIFNTLGVPQYISVTPIIINICLFLVCLTEYVFCNIHIWKVIISYMLILAIYDLICYYSLRLLMWTTLLTLLLCQSCALKDKDELISFWTFLSLLAQYLLFVFWHCQSSFVICSATMCLFEFLPNLCLS